MPSNNHSKIIALIFIIALGLLLAYAMLPFRNALFAALILFILLNPLNIRLLKKTSEKKAASLTMIIGILIILIPLSLAVSLIINEMRTITTQDIRTLVTGIEESIPYLNIGDAVEEFLATINQLIQRTLLSALGGITNTIIELTIMLFALYYLLINNKNIPGFIEHIVPFSKENSRKLRAELANVTNTTVIVTGIIALLQGILLGIGFWIAGIKAPIFWGFIGVIVSFLPIIGPWFLWLPAGLILLSQGNIGAGIFLFIWGVVLSNVDNIIRPQLQKKVGKMHPLTTLIGVFIGLPLFGIIGLVVGPLLLSYFFLMIKMYREEYSLKEG